MKVPLIAASGAGEFSDLKKHSILELKLLFVEVYSTLATTTLSGQLFAKLQHTIKKVIADGIRITHGVNLRSK